MAFFDFLDNIWKPVGKGLSEADTFMKREMPFDSGWGAPAALVATYFGGPAVLEAMGSAGEAGSGAGMLDSIGGNSGSFGGDLFQIGAPYAGDSQYAAQDVMQQARDVTSPSGSPTSWDTGAKSSTNDLLSNLLKNQQKTAQQNSDVYGHYKPTDVVRQPAFLQTPAAINVQDSKPDLAALIKALRG